MSRLHPPDIVWHSPHAYLRTMAACLLRFMLLLAVLLMPVRMAAAAHLPAPAGTTDAIASTAEHCDRREVPDEEDSSGAQVDCTMACAALPAFAQTLDRLSVPSCPAEPTRLARVDGRENIADPPPPRFS